VKTRLNDLGQNIKAMYGHGRSEFADTRTLWPTMDMAKQFGELVLAAVGSRKKDMSSLVNADGGYLVPEQLASRIIQLLAVYGKFRRDAMVIQMPSGDLKVPMVASDLTVYCPGEGQEIDESDMGIGQARLTAKKWAVLTAISNELSEDGVIAVAEIVGQSMLRSMAKKEDEVGFCGDGGDQYFGMTGIIGALLAVDDVIANIAGLQVGSGAAYSALTLDDFEGVASLLPPELDDTAKWYMSKRFWYKVIMPLVRGAGVNDPSLLLRDRASRFFMEYPVEFVHCMSGVGAANQVCALLGDLQMAAYLGERRQLVIEQSRDVLFKNDQTAIRATERIAVNAYGVGDETNPGAVVGLITAGS
jgi:HK97 family phage major capsid protein